MDNEQQQPQKKSSSMVTWIILVIVVIGLGVGLYFVLQDDTQNTNTNTTNTASTKNSNDSDVTIAEKTYTNDIFQYTLRLPAGATTYEGVHNFDLNDNINAQDVRINMPNDDTYELLEYHLTVFGAAQVSESVDEYAQSNVAIETQDSKTTVTFNGIEGIQYSSFTDSAIIIQTFFTRANGDVFYLSTETAAGVTLFSEAYKTEIRNTYNSILNSIEFTN